MNVVIKCKNNMDRNRGEEGETVKKESNKNKAPNISGSFQIADDQRQSDLESVEKEHELDEESMYYARIFMED
jgi:hypothetical protein